ncbi:Spx/MgsR family RNA polymerase-binding regulatory protein [Paenibacillus sp. HJL G12]|uniref:Spx/MgsR family RNA polymerase-binding regulatory protein n=1 Tax=Paenibacillus dendrobii TaxID=2691084 RepID=A0A7X3IHQ2_9BACL|nr:arsenate reductase family protein [Paenibacillus dendrobii]MWV44159.1 Spx/MgsR family RNA polymerase-binding regulatory protein [Paenibacillus dendrobii]
MSKLEVYQYPKCGTCRSAVKWLQAHGHEVELHHIAEEPPTPEVLSELVKLSGLPLKKFFNTSGEVYKQLGLKDKLAGMDEKEQIELLSSNGMLIKRPIVTDGSKVTVGYKEDQYESVWG